MFKLARVLFAQRNADVAGNMVKFISSHYGKNTQTTENPVHSGDSPTQKSIPPVINRYSLFVSVFFFFF